MPKSPQVEENVIDVLLRLLKDTFDTTVFKSYFYGDPVNIPNSLLPAISVDLQSSEYNHGPTGMDEIIHTVLIQVIFDKKKEFGKTDREVTLARTLHTAVQGREESTGQFIEESVMGMLRQKFTLDQFAINQMPVVRYGVIARPQDSWTVEAHITVPITELRIQNNRT